LGYIQCLLNRRYGKEVLIVENMEEQGERSRWDDLDGQTLKYDVLWCPLMAGGTGDHMRHLVSLAEIDACPFHLALESQSRTFWYEFCVNGLHSSSH
jgi:hypothetical protein